MGKVEVLDTPAGRVLKELLKSGVKLGISSRGMGSVREGAGEVVVEDDFQLICFDMVSEPSTPGAFLSPEASQIQMTMAENTLPVPKNSIEQALDEVLKGEL